MRHPTDMIAHYMAFVTPVVGHRLEREIDQWVAYGDSGAHMLYVTIITIIDVP